MNAEILTIGNELVSGFTIDTNSSWLGQKLLLHQIRVLKTSSIRDDIDKIKFELKNILSADIQYLFITGGLGPTHDDITRTAIQQFFNLEQEFDKIYYEELKFKFTERGILMPESNRSQAIIYNNCEMLSNPKGTARGISINYNGTQVYVLPGVPVEMKAIFNEKIKRNLPSQSTNQFLTIKSFGISESTLAEIISPVLKKWNKIIEFAFLPSHKGVDLRLINLKKNNIDLLNIKDDLYKVAEKYFFGVDNDSLELVVIKKLIQLNITLSIAESCTGGRLANYITSVSGSSNVFKGGVVAYSNQMKNDILSVDKKIIDEKGAVSKEVAFQMAKGIQNKTNSDIGIGITGISGPTGGNEDKPIGLVYVAITGLGISKVKKFILKIDRFMHQEMTAYIALNMVRRYYFGK